MGWTKRNNNSFMTWRDYIDYDGYYTNETSTAQVIKSFWTYWGVGAANYVFADSSQKVATVGDGKAISWYVEASTTTGQEYESLGRSSRASITNTITSNYTTSTYTSGTHYEKVKEAISWCKDTTMNFSSCVRYEVTFNPGIIVQPGKTVYMRAKWDSGISGRHSRVPNPGAVMIRSSAKGIGGTVETYNPKYTVTVNTGTGIASVSGGGSYSQGSTVTLGATVSDGYTWSTWSGTYTSAAQSYSFTMPASAVSMTANAVLKTYTISYNANGGYSAPASHIKTHNIPTTVTSTKPTGPSVTLTFDANGGTVSPASKAYTKPFKNWNTKSNGGGTKYESGVVFYANETTTLYAQYGAATVSDIPSATQNGYKFVGWFTSSDVQITNGSSLSSDTTVIARWDPNVYTVSYNANGGTNAPSPQQKTHGISLILTSQKPTRSHKITFNANGGTVSESSRVISCPFTRWNTNANGSGTSYNSGATYSAEGNATLYAQWSGATIGQLPTPTRANCQFVGWFTATSGGTQITANSTFLQDTVIYARWNYEVSYNPNHGNSPDAFDDDGFLLVSIPPSQIKQHDKALTLSSQSASWPGKEFMGWNTKADGTGTAYAVGGSYTTNAPLVLYAQWKIPSYTVTFDANGGKWPDGTTANKSYTVNHGSSITPPGTPSRDRRDFEGWNGNYFNIISNTTISAIWSGSLIWIRTATGWDRFLD